MIVRHYAIPTLGTFEKHFGSKDMVMTPLSATTNKKVNYPSSRNLLLQNKLPKRVALDIGTERKRFHFIRDMPWRPRLFDKVARPRGRKTVQQRF